jgi:hypothetical protein
VTSADADFRPGEGRNSQNNMAGQTPKSEPKSPTKVRHLASPVRMDTQFGHDGKGMDFTQQKVIEEVDPKGYSSATAPASTSVSSVQTDQKSQLSKEHPASVVKVPRSPTRGQSPEQT